METGKESISEPKQTEHVSEVDIIRAKYLLPSAVADNEIVGVTLDGAKKVIFRYDAKLQGYLLMSPLVLKSGGASTDCNCTRCKKITSHIVNGTVNKLKCGTCGTITEIKI